MNDQAETASQFAHHHGSQHPHQRQGSAGQQLGLALGAIGVVFGDIGTSPLYTLRECFLQSGLQPDRVTIYGFLSLIFWALTIIVSLKYVYFLLNANNRGEGGIMALAGLVLQGIRRHPRLKLGAIMLATVGVALFYGDGMITPAISVLSAVEGLSIFSHYFIELVLPLSVCIIIGLFLVQRHGTRTIGRVAAPIMVVWFLTLAATGAYQIGLMPQVLQAINPYYAFTFFTAHGFTALLGLGAVVLCITGAEAIYADMGHFGASPIRRAWFWLVYPSLLLNYYGQGALLLRDASALDNPFYRLVPPDWVLPLVGLSTAATIIASQAVITGAFSLSNQAMQIGLLPRLTVRHTDAHQRGQIYVPQINWMLLGGILLLLMNFRSSSALASMYGVAVTGTMLMTSCLILILLKYVWRRPLWQAVAFAGLYIVIDFCMFSTTMLKIHHGGYVSLLIAMVVFTVMMTWRRGRTMLLSTRRHDSMALPQFLENLEADKPQRVPGVGVYMAFTADVVPYPLLYNLRFNRMLHECVVLLTVRTEDRPAVPDSERLVIAEERLGIWHVVVRYGFMETPRVMRELRSASQPGFDIDFEKASFFVSRDRLVLSEHGHMAIWRQRLFSWLANNAVSATDYYHLPRSRVLEMGAQVEIGK